MMTIKFTDAAKHFKGEPHQIDAFEYLQKNTKPEVIQEFERRFRTSLKSKLPLSGVNLIKEFEGCILKAYPDPLTGGIPITIGWGSTRRKDGTMFMIGNTITQKEADELLNYQLETEYLPKLEKIPYWSEMNDNQKGALLSFAYNLGADFYGSSDFNTITKILRERRWKEVSSALYLYRNPGTNVEAGLARRRKAEGDLWSKV
jgi:lysozyme